MMKPVMKGYDVIPGDTREKKRKGLFRAARARRLFTPKAANAPSAVELFRDAVQTQCNVYRLWRDNVKFISNNYGCYYVHR